MFKAEINANKQESEDNPFSVDEIEPRLFLGNVTAAKNLNFLKKQQIKFILTVDSFPLPKFVYDANRECLCCFKSSKVN